MYYLHSRPKLKFSENKLQLQIWIPRNWRTTWINTDTLLTKVKNWLPEQILAGRQPIWGVLWYKTQKNEDPMSSYGQSQSLEGINVNQLVKKHTATIIRIKDILSHSHISNSRFLGQYLHAYFLKHTIFSTLNPRIISNNKPEKHIPTPLHENIPTSD